MATFRVVHRLCTVDVEAEGIVETPKMLMLVGKGERVVAAFPADGATAIVQVEAIKAALPTDEPAARPAKKRAAPAG